MTLLKKIQMQKSHVKISIKLYAIQTLSKLLYCSVTEETIVLLL